MADCGSAFQSPGALLLILQAEAELDDVDKRLEEDRQRRADLVAHSYDEERENLRLHLLRTEADAAFFTHVLEAPTNQTQREAAERRIDECQTTAADLRRQLGDPEQVLDRSGYLPAEWHEYDLSLQLFRSSPPSGSTAEKLARLLPGWWERCSACAAYRIEHQWGGSKVLPDFGYEQWRAMLPSRLRAIFAPVQPKQASKRKQSVKPKPLVVIAPGSVAEVMAKLAEAQTEHPTAEIRQGAGGSWELWPP